VKHRLEHQPEGSRDHRQAQGAKRPDAVSGAGRAVDPIRRRREL
jgi:hypothetical protein